MFGMSRISRFVLILVLSSFWLATLNLEIVKAGNTIQINHDGSVDGTDLLQRNDNTYTFLDDISGNIVILKDSITLDGAGFTLKGSGDSSEKGIDLSHKKNVTITNLVIMDYFHGILSRPGAGTATNITIQGNLIQNCDIGIEFQGTSNNLIKYNTFKNNTIDISINYVLGDNLITQNNIDSYIQVWLSDRPTIDMNHWTAYNGTDDDGDGIGDSPYYHHDILQDNNPLMNPVPVIPEFPSWTPLLVTLVAVLFVAVVYRKRLAE
jgi:parallel beta-helix repeat protein